jgi:hypothetical protein
VRVVATSRSINLSDEPGFLAVPGDVTDGERDQDAAWGVQDVVFVTRE